MAIDTVDLPMLERANLSAPARVRTAVSVVTLVRVTGWLALLVFAAAQAYGARHQLNVDGVAYLDVADAFLRGDWQRAINGHWSPLYSWLLAAIPMVSGSPYWESAAAHAVNVLVFVATLAAFEFMLSESVRRAAALRGHLRTPPDWAWYGIGYCLFGWASLKAITLVLVTPDLLTSGFLYLGVAILLRITRGGQTLWFAALGVALGLGYLAKAPMLPLGAGIMALAVLATPSQRIRRTLIAVASFAIVAGPFIAALSLQRGRLTFGESRIISYAWLVQDLPLRHWQGDARSTLVHPTRRVLENPTVYEFATPLPGTYPVWYDPSYWYEGIQPHFDFAAQLRALVKSAHEYYSLLLVGPLASLSFAIALMWSVTLWRRPIASLAAPWPLLLPALAGLAMFGLVTVFPRYVGPFIALLGLAGLASIAVPDTNHHARVLTATCAISVALMIAALAPGLLAQAGASAVDLANGEQASDHPHWQIATALRERGLQAGDRVAVLHAEGTSSWSGMTAWARAARVTIVAEILPEDAAAFWSAGEAGRERVFRSLTHAGARALVSPGARGEGWQSLGETGYSMHLLPSETKSGVESSY